MDQLITQHTEWLVAHVGLIWMALGGAALRVLLVLHEPLPRRLGNGVAGMIMALMLSDMTAAALTDGKYTEAYAVIYGLVAHELVMAVVKFTHQHAYPLLHRSVDFFMRLRLRLIPEDKPSPPNEENPP
ncbi:MAG: hypothetical protein VXW65_06940 [Pseudomonadota bacterium]|nr:hypothetical protein [Pseudomonadota bacterium]